MIGELVIKAALAVLTAFGLWSDGMPQRYLGEYTPPAVITYVEASAQQQGNELIFGNLIMELRDGVTAEIKDSEYGQTIKLNGAQKNENVPFPPMISIARYEAEYEREETLISALIDLVSDGNLYVEYEDKINNEYVFELGEGFKHYYAIVRGGDLYLVSEFYIEDSYGFSVMREFDRVKWKDNNEAIGELQFLHVSYFKITPETGMTFLCYGDKFDVVFYRDGYFDNNGCTTFKIEFDMYIYNNDFKDINFDGCTDISLFANIALIWDSTKHDFIWVEYPDDMPRANTWECFTETNTIWGYDEEYLPYGAGEGVRYVSRDNMDYTESLWQWDGITPIKRRECIAEVREDGVRIWAYEGDYDNVMFDESLTLAEWKDGKNENVRGLYKQFYDGFVPYEFFFPDEKEDSGKIPQGLLDELIDAMMSDAGFETFSAMINLNGLTDEEIYALAEENEDIRMKVLTPIWNRGDIFMAEADVDNDGIEDIIGEFFSGRLIDNAHFTLFKKQEDGTYISTDSASVDYGEFGIIAYEGKNYLVRMLYDERKKLDNGFCVIACEDGLYADEVYYTLYLEDYDLTLVSSEEGYEAFAEEVMRNAVTYDARVEKSGNIVGSAEEIVENNDKYAYKKYKADLDNDGDKECYIKEIVGGLYQLDAASLYFCFLNEEDERDEVISKVIDERQNRYEYCNVIMLWADEVGGETVVSVMYQTSLEDFVIVGYVVNGSKCREVYEISAAAVYGVERRYDIVE